MTSFDLVTKTKQQCVVVGSTLKADKKINANAEIENAMADFDNQIAKIMEEAVATV